MRITIEHTPVTARDFGAVFKILAGIDGHERSADDVETWMLAAHAGRWSRAQVAAAALALSAEFTGYRVQPGHMTEQINRNRDKIRALWYCPDPPRSLADDPIGEIEWRRRAALSFADRATVALASGDPLDEVPLTLDQEPPRPAIANGQERMRRMLDQAAERMSPPAAAGPRTAEGDSERRAAARAEIAAATAQAS